MGKTLNGTDQRRKDVSYHCRLKRTTGRGQLVIFAETEDSIADNGKPVLPASRPSIDLETRQDGFGDAVSGITTDPRGCSLLADVHTQIDDRELHATNPMESISQDTCINNICML